MFEVRGVFGDPFAAALVFGGDKRVPCPPIFLGDDTCVVSPNAPIIYSEEHHQAWIDRAFAYEKNVGVRRRLPCEWLNRLCNSRIDVDRPNRI